MKVISRAFNIRDWSQQVTCGFCKSVLEIEPEDLTESEDKPARPPAGFGYKYHVTCPDCGRIVYASLTEVEGMAWRLAYPSRRYQPYFPDR